MYLHILLLTIVLMTLCVLLSTAFVTLAERKILSYIQNRKGPNKVGPAGLLQPFSDALKLFHKQSYTPYNANSTLSKMSPTLTFLMTLLLILSLSFFNFTMYDQNFNILTFMTLSSLLVYPLINIGWSSNSKYSLLGTFRNVAQMISYEIVMFMIILTPIMAMKSYNSSVFFYNNTLTKISMMYSPMLIMWALVLLSETNRTPFDFAEGESELVSGFNVEYMSLPFTFIFLAEYTAITIMSMLTIMLFIPSYLINPLLTLTLTLLIIITRGTLPRYRFDLLMNTSWKILLPLTIAPPLMLMMSSTY